MTLHEIITECAEITRSKGFDVTQHATQIALMATEVGEALESIGGIESSDPMLQAYINTIRDATEAFEGYRKKATNYQDNTTVTDPENRTEELADICIRVFSYAGGNGLTDALIASLVAKMEKNRHRPERHGKAF